MKTLYYSIQDTVFDQFPGYVRGVVLACGVSNTESPPELIALMREAEAALRTKLNKDDLINHPRIASWRDAFRAFGAKPGKFRSSIEAMVRRVLGGNELPAISALVDIGNLISLRHLVPVGGHAIDVVKADLTLGPASGEEVFVPFGSEQPENPLPGEIIFAEGDTVLTRRWSWRQANHTLTLLSTKDIEFNVDGLPPVSPEEVKSISQETMDLVERFCGGHMRGELLSRENPHLALTPYNP